VSFETLTAAELLRALDDPECVRLRVKDVDFARFEIVVRDGKGAKDRITMLPRAVTAPLRAHLRGRWPTCPSRESPIFHGPWKK